MHTDTVLEAACADMSFPFPVKGVGGDRKQDDQTLDRFFPLGLRFQVNKRRADRPEQGDADQGPGQGAPPACSSGNTSAGRPAARTCSDSFLTAAKR